MTTTATTKGMEKEEEVLEISVEQIKKEMADAKTDKKIPKRKLEYAKKMTALLSEYDQCLVVDVTNVGSAQVADMRKRFRGRGRFLFGKNTLMRKVVRDYIKESRNEKLLNLLDLITGNTGLLFTKEDVSVTRKEIEAEKKQTAAKTGAVAPVDVVCPAGPTGMEPTQTSFFQAMNIPTRINRGQIDITDAVQVVFKGVKVGASESLLLTKLGIKPFFYGMSVKSVYADGDAYDAEVLDLTNDDIANFFFSGLRQIGALSFAINYPTIVTVPHSTLNVYKKMLALGLSLDSYTWENLALVKEMLANPDAFKAAAAAPAGGTGAAAAVEEPEEEEEESSEKAQGLFDESSSDDEDDDDESS